MTTGFVASVAGDEFTGLDQAAAASENHGGAERDEGMHAGASLLEDARTEAATATALYEREWTLSFVSNLEGSNPEADFLVFHYDQRIVSFAFTVIVVAVTVISVVTRTNVQRDWLVGMIVAWFIWALCFAAMVWLWRDRIMLEKFSGEAIAAMNGGGGGDAAETAAQSLGLPGRRNLHHNNDGGNESLTSINSHRRKSHVDAESRLPILLRTTSLQENAAYWEVVMVASCAASLCFSISLFLGKQNCIKGDNVPLDDIINSCIGSVQFDAAFVVIYTGAAILLNIRVKIFAPILLFMNLVFFIFRSIPEVPGVPDLIPQIVGSYALVSFVQTVLLIGVCYVRESSSRDYFETSQRLQFHTFRLSKLRNETERDIKKFCPPDAAVGVTEGHGLFRATDSAVVCVFSMNNLAAWNSVRCPIDAIETTNRFIEVLDGLRIVFDFKPTKYDTVGDRYVVMDHLDIQNGVTNASGLDDAAQAQTESQITKEVAEIVQNVFGFALLAVAECNLQLVPLLERDAFLPPGMGGELTHATCVETNKRSVKHPLRLCAAIETGRCACMYSPRTENILVVGECYDRAIQSLKLSTVCEESHVSDTLNYFRSLESESGGRRHDEVELQTSGQHQHHQAPSESSPSTTATVNAVNAVNAATAKDPAKPLTGDALAHHQSCQIARSIVVGSSACSILSATIKGTTGATTAAAVTTTTSSSPREGSGGRNGNALPVLPQSPTHGPVANPLTPQAVGSSSSEYAPADPVEINGVPILASSCRSFFFADLSTSHTTWLNISSMARRDAKPMRHDVLGTQLALKWVLVMLKLQDSAASPSVVSGSNYEGGLGGNTTTNRSRTTTGGSTINRAAGGPVTDGNNSASGLNITVGGGTAAPATRAFIGDKGKVNSSSARVTKSAAATAADELRQANSGTRNATSGTGTMMIDSSSRTRHRREDSGDHRSDADDADAPGVEGGQGGNPLGEEYALQEGAVAPTALLGDSTLDSDIPFRFLPTIRFGVPEIEREYLQWARSPLQLNLLVVSFAGTTAACIILIFVCLIYDQTTVNNSFDQPMPWAILSLACSLIGLGWTLWWVYITRRRQRRLSNGGIVSDVEIGSPEARACMMVIYFGQAVCYCATVYVSPQGSGALGNGQLLWMYALFGISMSRPMWYDPLVMWSLDCVTSVAFIVIWLIYPYRTSDIRTTHIFLFIAGAVVPLAMRLVMETGKRRAFVTELRVWMLQEKLNIEYDSMQEALKHIAPNFIGDEIVQALRQHHICHPDAYGVMCVVLPQLAICAVIELRPVVGGGSGSSATDSSLANLKKLGHAIKSILDYIDENGGDCISPLRVDGTRVILCGGVAKKDRQEHEEGLFKVERTHAERAHRFLKVCYELVFRVIPTFSADRLVQSRCFLTCGPLLGGVIGTGRISFNFFGSRIAMALHAFPEVAWNGVNYMVVSSSLVMMQSAVEDEALKRASANGQNAAMNNSVVMTPTETFRNASQTNSGTTPVHTVPSTPAGGNTRLLMPAPATPTTSGHRVLAPLEPHTPGRHSGSHPQQPNNHNNISDNSNHHNSNNYPPPRRPALDDVIVPHFVKFTKPTSLRVKGFPPMGVRFAAAPGYVVPPEDDE